MRLLAAAVAYAALVVLLWRNGDELANAPRSARLGGWAPN